MLLAVEDILVALLALLGAVANGVGLVYVSGSIVGSFGYPRSYHEIIAVLQCDGAIEIGEEDEFGVLEGELERLEVGGGHSV